MFSRYLPLAHHDLAGPSLWPQSTKNLH
uniref:Uncharacterized protein n=1 Tax=Anguilla anguilla TaxID=7936 RepID=A0A0E9UHX9_ANGAN